MNAKKLTRLKDLPVNVLIYAFFSLLVIGMAYVLVIDNIMSGITFALTFGAINHFKDGKTWKVI